jgi:predicted molibdopterin-dependent oxidoreductase YjgC
MNRRRIKIQINQHQVEAEPGMTVLECARKSGIFIPSLCELEDLPAFAGCRLCLVEIKGRPFWSPACQTLVEEGMVVTTSTEELEHLRRSVFELILSEHPYFCLLCSEKPSCEELKAAMVRALEPGGCIFCPKDGNCELQRVAEYLKIGKVTYEFEDKELPLWQKDPFISHNPNLCILCGRCVRVCGEIRNEGVLSFVHRGLKTGIGTFFDRTLVEAGCSFCGACVDVCPTASFFEKGIIPAKGKNLSQRKFICPLCSCGCELEAEILDDGTIRRIHPAADTKPSFMSGCARGRFGLKELLAEFKGKAEPEIKHGEALVEVSKAEAIESLALGLKKFDPEEIAFVFTEQNYMETLLAFLELGVNLGIKNLYWFYPGEFLRKIGQFEKETRVRFNRKINLARFSEFKSFLVVDSDLKAGAVTLWLEVNRALRTEARLIVLDSGLNGIDQTAAIRLKCRPGGEYLSLLALLRILIDRDIGLSFFPGFDCIAEKLNQVCADILAQASGLDLDDLKKAAAVLVENQPAALIFAERFLRQDIWKSNLQAVWNLALKLEAEIFPLTSIINEIFLDRLDSFYPVQVLSDLTGFEQKIRDKKIRAVYVLGDMPFSVRPEFLVIQNVFKTQAGAEADVFLPEASCLQGSGHLVSLEGKMITGSTQTNVLEDSQDDVQVFHEIGSKLGIKLKVPAIDSLAKLISAEAEKASGFDHLHYLPVDGELKQFVDVIQAEPKPLANEFIIIINQNLETYGGLILSETIPGFKRIQNPDSVWLNPTDTERLGLKNNDKVQIESESGRFSGKVREDYGVKPGTAVVKPVLGSTFWLGLYQKGIFKGRLRAENE